MVYLKGRYITGGDYFESFKTATEALARMQYLVDNNDEDAEDGLDLRSFIISFEDYEVE